jgi:hypothetical protein
MWKDRPPSFRSVYQHFHTLQSLHSAHTITVDSSLSQILLCKQAGKQQHSLKTMCKFTLNVVLCRCEDFDCKKRDFTLDANREVYTGHVTAVYGCYRDGPMCMDYFNNEDSDRLLVKLGMDPNNGNSKQDCKNKKLCIGRFQRDESICEDCLKHCDQECKTPEILG